MAENRQIDACVYVQLHIVFKIYISIFIKCLGKQFSHFDSNKQKTLPAHVLQVTLLCTRLSVKDKNIRPAIFYYNVSKVLMNLCEKYYMEMVNFVLIFFYCSCF